MFIDPARTLWRYLYDDILLFLRKNANYMFSFDRENISISGESRFLMKSRIDIVADRNLSLLLEAQWELLKKGYTPARDRQDRVPAANAIEKQGNI